VIHSYLIVVEFIDKSSAIWIFRGALESIKRLIRAQQNLPKRAASRYQLLNDTQQDGEQARFYSLHIQAG
jgi:hypothetical protein